jgi:hypothetical protein
MVDGAATRQAPNHIDFQCFAGFKVNFVFDALKTSD